MIRLVALFEWSELCKHHDDWADISVFAPIYNMFLIDRNRHLATIWMIREDIRGRHFYRMPKRIVEMVELELEGLK